MLIFPVCFNVFCQVLKEILQLRVGLVCAICLVTCWCCADAVFFVVYFLLCYCIVVDIFFRVCFMLVDVFVIFFSVFCWDFQLRILCFCCQIWPS